MSDSQTHYELLGLSAGSDITPKDVKEAYHQALLRYHPDKVHRSASLSLSTADAKYVPTIDRIVEAYNTLLDPSLRKAYDASLRSSVKSVAHHGIELFDLEDFEHHENADGDRWTKSCRCGSPVAYVLSEEDLEQVVKEQPTQPDGLQEILLGCRGCSLFVRVTFATAETG
ncbi:Diphthamide biosynthesis protein 4 [Cyphellophora attinorum]|uniref:Diphthamide biosynthesis protein 4 n=1 Tax=Cyphellophora attinorum TaxID=1664694 RepID=A0A0N1HTB1_9EURO|nr:Diphthamide biosynthesis protein 4 [Phialophora attinorum]KPI39703.1 Diphthamide biosynthesis protein 4 [Phialophora attinorum]